MSDHAETLQAEARELVEWLFTQVKVYRRHTPALTDDIKRFEDAAALIDSFRAGLTVVPPHPALRMELIRWVQVTQALPESNDTVLIIVEGADGANPGSLEGAAWYWADGWPIAPGSVLFWASLPAGPQKYDALTEEAAA